MVGDLELTRTPELRADFALIHARMSGSTPELPQFPTDEQFALYRKCRVLSGDGDVLDEEATEANLLELMHYLHENGLGVPKVAVGIRLFSDQTIGLAKRLHYKEYRERKMDEKAKKAAAAKQVVFQPAYV